MKPANLSSQVDGEKTSFTLPEQYDTGSLRVYYNGIRESPSSVTETSTSTFELDFAPENGLSLIVDYYPKN